MGTQGLKCSNLQSGSLFHDFVLLRIFWWKGCMYNKVLGYNLLIRLRVQLYSYNGIEYN